jgi:signal transduction histidine kinase
LTPTTALWMSGGVLLYYVLMLLMSQAGHYTPLLVPGAAGREYVHMSFVLIMLVSTVGLLTYLNMRSLQQALMNLRERSKQLLQAQEELVRKEKLAVLGQVAGSVGHELRNPLGVMSNAVYFLQTVLSDADATTREYLDIIKNEIADSERIVSDLLDSVRTKPPQPGIVGVQELIDQTLRKYSVPPSVTVRLEIPETLPPLRVDAMQIQQVLRNLISNGVEAMPDGGTLEIGAVESRPDGTVTVSVRDSGSGMAPEVLAKLFQPLFTTKARGIGLGLVVVKNLTQANGGMVAVQSEVGKGTTFTVTLPLAGTSGSEPPAAFSVQP